MVVVVLVWIKFIVYYLGVFGNYQGIKNLLGISLVFLFDLNWLGWKIRLDFVGFDWDSVRNFI